MTAANHARILVVGTGSIGRRHIVNLVALGATVSAYSYRAEATGTAVELPEGVSLRNRLDEALAEDHDAIVVANRTHQHIETATSAALRYRHLFIEKPLSNSLRGVDALAAAVESNSLIVETGFMLRFHPNLIWLKRFLESDALGELHYARALFGQHLSTWRPGTDYRQCYSARRGEGGGVLFDLTHEFDLLNWFFGDVAEVHAMTSQSPALGIDSEALAQVGLRFRSGLLAQVHLDYLRPAHTRQLEIVGANGVLNWDYNSGSVSITAHGRTDVVDTVPAGFERNHLFVGYLRYFLERLTRRDLPAACSLTDGIAALRVALASHQSALLGRTVDPRQINESFAVTKQ